MKNRAVLKFFLIYFGFTITSNFVHPITPAFLQMIEAPSYIQGVAFSVMSFFTFLTAPFWGKMGDRKPYPKMIAFGYFGYALGQTVFAAARSVPMLLAARTISGLLNGALQVNALAYLISVSDSESRGKYMAYYAMLQSVGTCIGYFVGGSIGDYSLMLVFYIPGRHLAHRAPGCPRAPAGNRTHQLPGDQPGGFHVHLHEEGGCRHGCISGDCILLRLCHDGL